VFQSATAMPFAIRNGLPGLDFPLLGHSANIIHMMLWQQFFSSDDTHLANTFLMPIFLCFPLFYTDVKHCIPLLGNDSLRVLENRVLMKIFGPKRQAVL